MGSGQATSGRGESKKNAGEASGRARGQPEALAAAGKGDSGPRQARSLTAGLARTRCQRITPAGQAAASCRRPLPGTRRELAQVQPASTGTGGGRDHRAAGASAVRGHLRQQPGRVLHGPGGRPDPADGGGAASGERSAGSWSTRGYMSSVPARRGRPPAMSGWAAPTSCTGTWTGGSSCSSG